MLDQDILRFILIFCPEVADDLAFPVGFQRRRKDLRPADVMNISLSWQQESRIPAYDLKLYFPRHRYF